ncbi:MAG: hypothetical protein J7551_02475 [Chloroflexi bacterium]|nr:hypothetical protein [Chloroflexota bacterium]
MDYHTLGTLRVLLNLLGYGALIVGVIAALINASGPLGRFEFPLCIVQVMIVFLVVLPMFVLAELIQVFVDIARNVSAARFSAESIQKRLDELYELETRRERTRNQG